MVARVEEAAEGVAKEVVQEAVASSLPLYPKPIEAST